MVVTNLEKMNELVGADANREIIILWAEINRVCLVDLPSVTEFILMEESVDAFMSKEKGPRYERELWGDFLDSEYLGGSGDGKSNS